MGKTQYQPSWEKGREKFASCLACGGEIKMYGSGIKQVEAHEATEKHKKHLFLVNEHLLLALVVVVAWVVRSIH